MLSSKDEYDKYTSVGNLGLTVNNFGILGNGVYSYHYLVLSELKKGKDNVN